MAVATIGWGVTALALNPGLHYSVPTASDSLFGRDMATFSPLGNNLNRALGSLGIDTSTAALTPVEKSQGLAGAAQGVQGYGVYGEVLSRPLEGVRATVARNASRNDAAATARNTTAPATSTPATSGRSRSVANPARGVDFYRMVSEIITRAVNTSGSLYAPGEGFSAKA
ncbi:MAG: hypothetical protein H7831_15220 [Magnetococcus sp. WYHC-3]